MNAEVISALQSLADETTAVNQFKAMLKGEVMNKIDGFECETSFFTACRNIFSDLNNEELLVIA